MHQITFRQATIEDATFVALVMMEAVGIPMMEERRMPEELLVNICRREDTLYSYRNCVLTEVDGRPVGGLISYVGEGYHDVKVHTFGLVKDFVDFDVDSMDDETKAGEYYLDSAAVLPTYRGKGIGRQLIEYGVSKAKEQSLLPILACDPANMNAYNLYTSIGFKEDGHLFIFGEDYLRMILEYPSNL